jgi:putative DNA primase/helicase
MAGRRDKSGKATYGSRAEAKTLDYLVMGANGPRFSAPKFGAHLRLKTPIARGSNGSLYYFQDDGYQPNGEEFIRAEVADALGPLWIKKHATEVVTWLRDTAPPIDEEPPLDRIRVANGDLILKQGRGGRLKWDLQAADPEVRTLVSLPVAYDPDARAPKFERALEVMFEDCPDLIQTTYEVYGYAITPDNREQKAFMVLGTGGNGKTTWLNVLKSLLGPANCTGMSLHHLSERFATARLYGKLANICAEISASELQESYVFKAITGGDAVPAEVKHGKGWDFVPFARLFFAANHPPASRDNSIAYFDRWAILPFRNRIRGKVKERKSYWTELAAEMPGVLNLALSGLREYRKRGRLWLPEESGRELNRYREMSDNVMEFLADAEVGALPVGQARPLNRLYDEYHAWCSRVGRESLGRGKFRERLEDQPLVEKTKRGNAVYFRRNTKPKAHKTIAKKKTIRRR